MGFVIIVCFVFPQGSSFLGTEGPLFHIETEKNRMLGEFCSLTLLRAVRTLHLNVDFESFKEHKNKATV